MVFDGDFELVELALCFYWCLIYGFCFLGLKVFHNPDLIADVELGL